MEAVVVNMTIGISTWLGSLWTRSALSAMKREPAARRAVGR